MSDETNEYWAALPHDRMSAAEAQAVASGLDPDSPFVVAMQFANALKDDDRDALLALVDVETRTLWGDFLVARAAYALVLDPGFASNPSISTNQGRTEAHVLVLPEVSANMVVKDDEPVMAAGTISLVHRPEQGDHWFVCGLRVGDIEVGIGA